MERNNVGWTVQYQYSGKDLNRAVELQKNQLNV